MITVQMTLESKLVKAVDQQAKKLGLSRSAATRIALNDFLKRIATLEKEKKHAAGYKSTPVKSGEFDPWESEQVWPK